MILVLQGFSVSLLCDINYCDFIQDDHHHRFIVRFPIGLDFPSKHSLSRGANEEYWDSVFTTGYPSRRQPHAWDASIK